MPHTGSFNSTSVFGSGPVTVEQQPPIAADPDAAAGERGAHPQLFARGVTAPSGGLAREAQQDAALVFSKPGTGDSFVFSMSFSKRQTTAEQKA